MVDTDTVAIQRVLDGDGDGFRVLVDRYSQALFRLAYRMMGSEADAEDVVQETFVRAYRNLASYDGRASFSTWLYRIATNYSLDLLEARKRRGQAPLEDEEGAGASRVIAATPAPDRQAMSGEISRRLNAAMAQLSARERTAFVLRHFEEQSIYEISQTLGIGESATKHSVFRAVQKLRQALRPVVDWMS